LEFQKKQQEEQDQQELKRKREKKELSKQEEKQEQIKRVPHQQNLNLTEEKPASKKESHLKEKWRTLKLKPKMDVSENSREYTITSYIPGMRQEDLHVKMGANHETITVEGIREPSPKEEAQMRSQIRNQYRFQIYEGEDEDMLLLRMGYGRYGKFVETYRLPEDANPNGIRASYEGGTVHVVIPKRQRRNVSVPPYAAYSDFFGNNDFWW